MQLSVPFVFRDVVPDSHVPASLQCVKRQTVASRDNCNVAPNAFRVTLVADAAVERKRVQTDSRLWTCSLTGHLRRHRSGSTGTRGVRRVVAGLFRDRRFVTSAAGKARLNALVNRGPAISLKRRRGSKSLPVAGMQTIATATGKPRGTARLEDRLQDDSASRPCNGGARGSAARGRVRLAEPEG